MMRIATMMLSVAAILGCQNRGNERVVRIRIFNGSTCMVDEIVDITKDNAVGNYGLEYAVRGECAEILVQVDKHGMKLESRTVAKPGDAFLVKDGDATIVIERMQTLGARP